MTGRTPEKISNPFRLLGCDPSLNTKHKRLVGTMNLANATPNIIIKNGEKPFFVWRCEMGHSIQNMAEKIEMSNDAYIAAERGEFSFTSEQIIGFCKVCDILPIDLLPENGEMPQDVCVATYDFMRSLNSKSTIYGMLFDRLRDEAVISESYERIKDARGFIKDKDSEGLVIQYITKMLQLDGSERLAEVDGYDDVQEGIENDVKYSQEELKTEIESLELQNAKTWKKINELGYRLYPSSAGEAGSWSSVFSSLAMVGKLFKSKDKFIDYYGSDPASIGQMIWPKKPKDIILDGNRYVGSWGSAHKEHVGLFDDYYTACARIRKLRYASDTNDRKLDILESWIDDNRQLLEQYMNRQFLISKPEFKHLRALTMERFTPENPRPISLASPLGRLNF